MSCLLINGCVVNTSYAWRREANDLQSPLIQRCAMAIDLGADQGAILDLCLQEGQSPAHAFLTYTAGLLLSNYRKEE